MIYFDHNATSPISKIHLDELYNILNQRNFGNPSSPHLFGRNASTIIEETRRALADYLNVDRGEIIFTSGATESNNLATKGVIENYYKEKPLHVISSQIEHPSILEPLEFAKDSGYITHSKIKVDTTGCLRIEDIIKEIRKNTKIITIIAASNETGALQDSKLFGDWLHYRKSKKDVRKKFITDSQQFQIFDSLLLDEVSDEDILNIHYHVDAVQVFGKLEPKLWLSQGMSSFSISGHKIGALSGIGVFFLKKGYKFSPCHLGGGQEKKKRSGTENLAGIISLGISLRELNKDNYFVKRKKITLLVDSMFEEIKKLDKYIVINTPKNKRLYNTLNFSFKEDSKIYGEDFLLNLDMNSIYASSGSACSSSANLPSHVIMAQHNSKYLARNAIRVSLGMDNTSDEVHAFLRNLSSFI